MLWRNSRKSSNRAPQSVDHKNKAFINHRSWDCLHHEDLGHTI